MRAALMRTGSMPVHQRFVSGSPKASISRQNSVGESFSASRISLNVRSWDRCAGTGVGMRRVLSESDVIRSERMVRSGGTKGSEVRIAEEEEEEDGEKERKKMGEYYREMVRCNPKNSVVLMNYGRFLYEVEEDAERAEEYYGRAILESGGDGEALRMYGKLVWETHRDEERAKGYFQQALLASPHDSTVLGSYAHFMWEADADDDDDDDDDDNEQLHNPSSSVLAFA